MKLFLVQHGEAESKEVNSERPLTKKGQNDVKNQLKLLENTNISKTYHSGKLRAKQTAEILAQGKKIIQRDKLAPNDSVDSIVEEIKKSNTDLMIVGHLPFLTKLASFLLTGKEDRTVIAFKQGAILCLENVEGDWSVLFMCPPSLL